MRTRRLLMTLMLALATAAAGSVHAQPAAADSHLDFDDDHGGVGAQRSGATYTGTIWVDGEDRINRTSTASGGCIGCRWSVIPNCPANSPGDVGWDAMCVAAASNCNAAGVTNYRVYVMRPPDDSWDYVDTVCWGPNNTVTVVNIPVEADEAFKSMRPVAAGAALGQQAKPLVNLATYFIAAGEDEMSVTVTRGGIVLVVTAEPRYHWDFGDGQTSDTESPGRRYRAGDNTTTPPGAADAVMHWYRTTETFQAELTTTWHGSYRVNGGAVVDIADEITVAAPPLPVVVNEARAILYN